MWSNAVCFINVWILFALIVYIKFYAPKKTERTRKKETLNQIFSRSHRIALLWMQWISFWYLTCSLFLFLSTESSLYRTKVKSAVKMHKWKNSKGVAKIIIFVVLLHIVKPFGGEVTYCIIKMIVLLFFSMCTFCSSQKIADAKIKMLSFRCVFYFASH